jgi:hypothetical protein
MNALPAEFRHVRKEGMPMAMLWAALQPDNYQSQALG